MAKGEAIFELESKWEIKMKETGVCTECGKVRIVVGGMEGWKSLQGFLGPFYRGVHPSVVAPDCIRSRQQLLRKV